MPCYDPRDDDDCTEVTGRMQRATRAACEMARFIREKGFKLNNLSASTVKWVMEHDALDAAREKREAAERLRRQLIRRARAKLTSEERKLLGL